MLIIRFKTNHDDPRPVKWPIKHPYWVTGYAADESHAIIVSYADSKEYILDNWPDAKDLDEVDGNVQKYFFTDRFPKPSWFVEPTESQV